MSSATIEGVGKFSESSESSFLQSRLRLVGDLLLLKGKGTCDKSF